MRMSNLKLEEKFEEFLLGHELDDIVGRAIKIGTFLVIGMIAGK